MYGHHAIKLKRSEVPKNNFRRTKATVRPQPLAQARSSATENKVTRSEKERRRNLRRTCPDLKTEILSQEETLLAEKAAYKIRADFMR